MRRTNIHGHALRSEGEPYMPHTTDDGEPGWIRVISWDGRGLCECGATSPPLDSNRARQRWHAEHKDSVRHASAEGKAGSGG
jgi:hypothetical protein